MVTCLSRVMDTMGLYQDDSLCCLSNHSTFLKTRGKRKKKKVRWNTVQAIRKILSWSRLVWRRQPMPCYVRLREYFTLRNCWVKCIKRYKQKGGKDPTSQVRSPTIRLAQALTFLSKSVAFLWKSEQIQQDICMTPTCTLLIEFLL